MKVRFYIEKRRGKDGRLLTSRRPIFMTVAFHGKRVLISTGKNVDLKWWDHTKQQVREMHPDASVINRWLETLAYTAGTVWKSLASLSENPGVGEFRDEFERLRPRFSGGFFDIMFLFMEEGSRRWSISTYQKVRTFYNQLKEFEKSEMYPLHFNTMNESFLYRFRDYLEKKSRSESTIRKMVNLLVWYLNWATKNGYNVYYDYRGFYKMLDKGSATEKIPAKCEPVYLEWDELLRFLKHSPCTTVKERVRDLFCLSCFTGLRFGELRNLTKEDVMASSVIVRKGDSKVRYVPVSKYAAVILEKYKHRYYRDNAALPPVSAMTVNKYLRVMAKELKLERTVAVGIGSRRRAMLWEVLTAGAGVQTFIMHALRLEIPADVIASFTGVTSDHRIKLMKQELAMKEIKKFDLIEHSQ
ncbi:MAG: site-specific integrase [Bacteroidales bacterium]